VRKDACFSSALRQKDGRQNSCHISSFLMVAWRRGCVPDHFSCFNLFGQLNGIVNYYARVGVISDSHKSSDSIPSICRNDALKLAPSLHTRHDPRLTARELGQPDQPTTTITFS
jgi:hypothetical protein